MIQIHLRRKRPSIRPPSPSRPNYLILVFIFISVSSLVLFLTPKLNPDKREKKKKQRKENQGEKRYPPLPAPNIFLFCHKVHSIYKLLKSLISRSISLSIFLLPLSCLVFFSSVHTRHNTMITTTTSQCPR